MSTQHAFRLDVGFIANQLDLVERTSNDLKASLTTADNWADSESAMVSKQRFVSHLGALASILDTLRREEEL